MIEEDQGFLVRHYIWNMTTTVWSKHPINTQKKLFIHIHVPPTILIRCSMAGVLYEMASKYIRFKYSVGACSRRLAMCKSCSTHESSLPIREGRAVERKRERKRI